MPELDGLRAIAVLLVVGRHATRVFPQPIAPVAGYDLATPLVNGWMGVDLFFVLSGFLISYHWLRHHRALSVRGYAANLKKRVLRIVPAYYAFLLFVVLVGVPGYAASRERLGFRVAYHLAFLQDYLPADIVVAFWSLGVEEKFYLVAPLLVVALGKLRPTTRGVALSFAILVPAALRAWTFGQLSQPVAYEVHFRHLRSPFHVSFDALLVGVGCAFVFASRERTRWTQDRRSAGILLLAGAVLAGGPLFVAPMLEGSVSAVKASLLGLTSALGFGCLVLGVALRTTPLTPLLASAPLRFFSKISYSLYLVHLCFLELTKVAMNDLVAAIPQAALQFVVYLVVYSFISVMAALVLHLAIERPFLRIKDRIHE